MNYFVVRLQLWKALPTHTNICYGQKHARNGGAEILYLGAVRLLKPFGGQVKNDLVSLIRTDWSNGISINYRPHHVQPPLVVVATRIT